MRRWRRRSAEPEYNEQTFRILPRWSEARGTAAQALSRFDSTSRNAAWPKNLGARVRWVFIFIPPTLFLVVISGQQEVRFASPLIAQEPDRDGCWSEPRPGRGSGPALGPLRLLLMIASPARGRDGTVTSKPTLTMPKTLPTDDWAQLEPAGLRATHRVACLRHRTAAHGATEARS
jgi:hypothetical protein